MRGGLRQVSIQTHPKTSKTLFSLESDLGQYGSIRTHSGMLAVCIHCDPTPSIVNMKTPLSFQHPNTR